MHPPATSEAVAALAVVAAAALGFILGLRQAARRAVPTLTSLPRRKSVQTTGVPREAPLFLAGRRHAALEVPLPPRCARERDGLCECGVRLQDMSPEDVSTHRTTARHRRNLLALGGASEVVVCEEVGEYRAAAQQLVGSDDCVLEVGCHVGGTTKVLAAAAGHLVGLDRQPSLVAQARQRLPDVQFEICDAFDAQSILALAQKQKLRRFTKVFVDISGSRDLSTVVRLLDIYENTIKPDVLVVKSQALKRLLLRSQLWVEHPDCAKQETRSP